MGFSRSDGGARRRQAVATTREEPSLLGRLVAIAEAEVGIREEGGQNRGPRIETYQQATWLPPGPWPWCAAFTAWVMREWLSAPEVRAALGLVSDADVGRWRCRDSRAFGWKDWAAQRGVRLLPEGRVARAGDFVVYDFSHIGIVVEDQPGSAADLVTVEGNTNGAGTRESDTGDGVWRKRRAPSLVDRLIRVL